MSHADKPVCVHGQEGPCSSCDQERPAASPRPREPASLRCDPCFWRDGSIVTGSDVVPVGLGYGRVVHECPPCRGMDVPALGSTPEEVVARRYEKVMRAHGALPEVVDLSEPCP